MKYWISDGKQAQGPYEIEQLKGISGFGPDSLVAPDGAVSADQWRAAKTFDNLFGLFANKPPPLPRPLPEPAAQIIPTLPVPSPTQPPAQAATLVPKTNSHRGGLVFGIVSVAVLIAGILAYRSSRAYSSAGGTEGAPINGQEEAYKAALGTWTFTESPLPENEMKLLQQPGEFTSQIIHDQMEEFVFGWDKFIFKEDGKCERYYVLPTDNGWGKSIKKCKWKIVTDKYQDTGIRYFAIDSDGDKSGVYAIFQDSTHFTVTRSGYTSVHKTFTKGDAFPFSK